MALQAIAFEPSPEHRGEWLLRRTPEAPLFLLRCRFCGKGFREVGFAWTGGAEPTLTYVFQQLDREEERYVTGDCDPAQRERWLGAR